MSRPAGSSNFPSFGHSTPGTCITGGEACFTWQASQDLARTHALLVHGSAAANPLHEVNSALEIFFTQACVVLLRRRCQARASGPTHRALILGSPAAEL